jgi:hypothetical protein
MLPHMSEIGAVFTAGLASDPRHVTFARADAFAQAVTA